MVTKKEEKLLSEKITEERIAERSSSLTSLTVRELADLDDVVITSLADNHILTYDSATGKWINEAP